MLTLIVGLSLAVAPPPQSTLPEEGALMLVARREPKPSPLAPPQSTLPDDDVPLPPPPPADELLASNFTVPAKATPTAYASPQVAAPAQSTLQATAPAYYTAAPMYYTTPSYYTAPTYYAAPTHYHTAYGTVYGTTTCDPVTGECSTSYGAPRRRGLFGGLFRRN